MVNEDYVSFETAELLKEKGFNEPTYAYYLPNASFYLSPREIDNKNLYAQGCVSAPTLQMAMKWLREAHKIAINIGWGEVFEENYQWWCIILNQNNGKILRENEYHKTYEEACAQAVKYCLTNLIDMTREDEIKIAKLIRQETGCGLAEASSAFGKLLDALKRHPKPVFDHQPYELKVEWVYDDDD